MKMSRRNSKELYGCTAIFVLCALFPMVKSIVDTYGTAELRSGNGRAYGVVIYPIGMNYADARSFCDLHSAHLVVPKSLEFLQVTAQLLRMYKNKIKESYNNWQGWIGINDIEKEGEWRTEIGSNYPRWLQKWAIIDGVQQPSDPTGHRDNCGAVNNDTTIDDTLCDLKFPFFCEWENIDTTREEYDNAKQRAHYLYYQN